jgi:hypothetical protein
MSISVEKIQTLIDKGDNKRARYYLKQILKEDPSADAWYMMALTLDDELQQIKCLRSALKMDAFHSPSNRLLHKVEGGMPLHEQEKRKREKEKRENREVVPLKKIEREMKKDRFQRHAERQRTRTRYGCLFSFLLSASCSLFAITAVGMLPGFIGTMASIFGGPKPVYEVEGTPIEERPDAIVIMTPAQSNDASNQEVEIMDHGYLHEYKFDAVQRESYAIYVQFMSVSANHVSRNVVIIDPEGTDATGLCERQRILEGDMGTAFTCQANMSGEWAVRILGVTGESIGAYFVGVEKLDF